uniref:Uncharacterized protein n=1 Tax=Amphimedon queenslandica TaxID=400682 RepID=A0A1X7U0U1_AMPQE
LSAFWDAYKTAVHDNPSLSKRGGLETKIKVHHIEQLMRFESVSSEHHLVELRRLNDKTESNIRRLKTLGVSADAYGTLFIPIFMKKLPQELRLSLTRKISTAEWSIVKILEVLRDELEEPQVVRLEVDLNQLIQAMLVISVGRTTPPQEHILVVGKGVAVIVNTKDIVHLTVGK